MSIKPKREGPFATEGEFWERMTIKCLPDKPINKKKNKKKNGKTRTTV